MFFDDLLYHGFILSHIAVRETVLMPNAAPQPLPEAGAERTLEAVGCRRLFGGVSTIQTASEDTTGLTTSRH
jgi:hypothetical protein